MTVSPFSARRSTLRRGALAAAVLLAGVLLAGGHLAVVSPAMADPGDPTETSSAPRNQPTTGGKSGTFLDGLFSSSEPALARFERPSAGYGAIMAKRPLALLIQRSRGYGLIQEPATEGYLNEILRRIMAASGFGDLGARVYLHSDRAVSAVATPDGGIYVNQGMLAKLQNEAELAFLLAHELAHFLYMHHESDWFVDTQHGLLTSVEKMKEISDELSGVLRQRNNPLGDDIRKASQIGAVVFDLSSIIVHPAWGREQEEEADFLGIDLMIAAGYDPTYSVDLLRIVGGYEEELRRQAGNAGGALGLRSLEAFGILNEQNAGNPIIQGIAQGFGQMISEISSDHYPVEKRVEAVNNYIAKFHQTYPDDLPATLPWAEGAKHPLADIDKRYADAETALERLNAGDVQGAVALARKAIDGITEHHAYPRLVFFDIRRKQGDLKNAGRNLEIALGAAEPALVIYEMWLDVEEERGRWKEVVAVLEQAERTVGDSPTLLPHKILAYSAVGRRQDAANLLTKCQYEYRAIAEVCSNAAEGKRPKAPPIDRGKGHRGVQHGKNQKLVPNFGKSGSS